jgi:hypothetical protein
MGTGDTATFTIGGGWDIFDRASSVADFLLKKIEEDKVENGEQPIEFHLGKKDEELGVETVAHFFDPVQNRIDRLNHVKELIAEACLICQEVMQEL